MKWKVYKSLFTLSAVLLLVFAASVATDHFRYTATLNSAPFSLWVLIRAVEFVLPALIVFAIGCILKRKGK